MYNHTVMSKFANFDGIYCLKFTWDWTIENPLKTLALIVDITSKLLFLGAKWNWQLIIRFGHIDGRYDVPEKSLSVSVSVHETRSFLVMSVFDLLFPELSSNSSLSMISALQVEFLCLLPFWSISCSSLPWYHLDSTVCLLLSPWKRWSSSVSSS